MKYLIIRDEFLNLWWVYYILQKYIQPFFKGSNTHVLFMWHRFRPMIRLLLRTAYISTKTVTFTI